MRLVLKLLMMALPMVVVQEVLDGGGGALDELQLGIRTYVNELSGGSSSDPQLLDSAKAFMARQQLRDEKWRANANARVPASDRQPRTNRLAAAQIPGEHLVR